MGDRPNTYGAYGYTNLPPPVPWANTPRPDPNADYGRLWLAVHDYIVCQARQAQGDDDNGAALTRAYSELVEAHNLIHRVYIAGNEGRPLEIAGT